MRQIRSLFEQSDRIRKQRTVDVVLSSPAYDVRKTGDDLHPLHYMRQEMYDDLSQLTDNNVSVEIITNDVAKGANPWGCTDYLNEKEKIWRTGVKVYEYMAPHSCHTKAVLIDDRMSIVGSYNLDMRSTYLDTELMLAVDSTELNAIIRKEAEHDKTFSKTMENGKYTYGENYKTKELSTGKKLFYATLRQIIKPLRRFL